jgi:metal transporter CNNM
MGSDDLNLRVLATSSDDAAERKQASKVLKLLAKGRHWVLVVLLLSNVVRVLLTYVDSSLRSRWSTSLFLFSLTMFSEAELGL